MEPLKIDGHRHVLFTEAEAAARKLKRGKANLYPSMIDPKTEEVNRKKEPEWNRKMSDFDENVADLVAAGMDVGILQPTQTMSFHWAEVSAAAELTRMVNERMAEGVARHPDHLVGLAIATLQDPKTAAGEIVHAVRKLGLKGVAAGSNVNGHGFDEEEFEPFFDALEELDVPMFIHPTNPAGTERIRNYFLANTLGFPMESAIFASQLVFGGVLDRHPRLRICLAHAGGVLPFLLGRLEHSQSGRPEAQEHCRHPFSHYLKNFYVDTIIFRPDILRFVVEIMPEGHVFMGTDYPYDMADMDPVSSIKAAISDEALQKSIFGTNLQRVMGLVQDRGTRI